MKHVTVGGWGRKVHCRIGHVVEIFYTLPDYGDAPALYQCGVSGDLFAVSPDAEHYVGPAWDELRQRITCPTCGESLTFVREYPHTFRCAICGLENHIELQIDRYPPDEERATIRCWDPYQ